MPFRVLSAGLAVLVSGFVLQVTTSAQGVAKAAVRPAIGTKAPDFELMSLAGDAVKLSEATKKSKVVVVVLRGYPGYQCPLCTRQVANLVGKAGQIASLSAQVLLVYPGPESELDTKAKEFIQNTKLPAGFTLLLDPDYKFTNAYGLRWNAPNETVYPTTMIIDQTGKIQFIEISSGHGGRVDADVVIAKLKALS